MRGRTRAEDGVIAGVCCSMFDSGPKPRDGQVTSRWKHRAEDAPSGLYSYPLVPSEIMEANDPGRGSERKRYFRAHQTRLISSILPGPIGPIRLYPSRRQRLWGPGERHERA